MDKSRDVCRGPGAVTSSSATRPATNAPRSRRAIHDEAEEARPETAQRERPPRSNSSVGNEKFPPSPYDCDQMFNEQPQQCLATISATASFIVKDLAPPRPRHCTPHRGRGPASSSRDGSRAVTACRVGRSRAGRGRRRRRGARRRRGPRAAHGRKGSRPRPGRGAGRRPRRSFVRCPRSP
jgi:hypothetical protein